MARVNMYKRYGKYYYLDYYFQTRDGTKKRKRKSVGRNKKLAEDLKAKLEYELAKGEHKFGIIERSIDGFLDEHMEYINTRKSNITAERTYYGLIHIRRFCAKRKIVRVSEVDKRIIEEYVTWRLKQGRSNKTINHELGLIKNLFDRAMEFQNIDENPVTNNARLRYKPPKPRYFTKDEIKNILQGAEIYYDYYMLLLHTGLRSGDAGCLSWTNINLKRNEISIVTQKGEDPLVIPINQTLRSVLKQHKTQADNFVFPDMVKRWNREKARIHLQKVCNQKGIDTRAVNLHTFRHTFASQLILNGVGLYEVSKLMGHKSLSMTQRYAHLSVEHLKKAVKVLNFK